MKNTAKQLLIPVICLATSIAAVQSYAQPISIEGSGSVVTETQENAKGDHRHKKRHFKRMARFLGLSDEQKAQIKDIRLAAKSEREAHKSEMGRFREEMKALVNALEFDESAFLALHSEYQATLTQAALHRAKTKHAIFQILTAEQKQKAEAMSKRGRKPLMF